MIKFFPEHTNWYKGNLHSHTTNSDGAWTPDEAVEHYKANGYAFLCLSDHNLYTDYRYKYNSDLFLILPGTERKHIIRYCGELGIPVEERAFTLEELYTADEILVTSTSHPSMRAMELNKRAVGMKNPELIQKLRDKYLSEIGK